MKGKEVYQNIIVESVRCNNGVQHGDIHICPLPGQYPFTPDMFVECSNSMKRDYPVGTKFRIRAKITSKEGGTPFIYSHYTWPFEVLNDWLTERSNYSAVDIVVNDGFKE